MFMNPLALAFVALATCIGALAGSWLWGLTVGLFIVVCISVAEADKAGRRW